MEYNITKKMIESSLVSMGDTSKLSKAIKKAKEGNDITVAFLGGSITQGCNASIQENCYAYKTYLWFKETFNNINVKYINAGVGATGSVIGVHRAEKQVLLHNPDILFIDFAVNDKNTIYDKKAYESLVRKILSMDKAPAIIEVFMSNFDGSNVQAQQIEIGKKYDIPMISFRDSVFSEIENNNLKWEDVASDEVHPNDYGHHIISRILINFLENVVQNINENEKEINLGEPIFSEAYINGEVKNSTNLEAIELVGFEIDKEGFQVFNNGWKFININKEDAKLKVEIEGKNIFILYKKTIKDTAGKFEVRINNKENISIDTYFENGWGDYSEYQPLVEGNTKEKHTIEINTINEENKEFYIMGFLVS